MNENELVVSAEHEGRRLDKFLMSYFNKADKSFIYKMLRKKRIKLNDARASGNELLKPGDRLKFYLSPETMDSFMEESAKPDGLGEIDIVYEDENILLCNKPAGLLSHSGNLNGISGAAKSKDTMIDRVLFYLREKGEYSGEKGSAFTPALCNRLDRNTSGLVLCGKTSASLRELNRIIAARMIGKWYAAIVVGEVKEAGVLRGVLTKDERTNKVSLLGSGTADEKIAVTEFYPERCAKYITLLRVKLVTGKTHQIRAQLAEAGHPILGDEKYGDARVNQKYGVKGQLLHARKMVFKAGSGMFAYLNGKEFEAEWPEKFQEMLRRDFSAGT